MYRPLSDDEKKQYLKECAMAALQEVKRREKELKEIRDVASTMFAMMLPKFTPTIQIGEAPMPSGMKTPPFEELWSVKPKVTFEQ